MNIQMHTQMKKICSKTKRGFDKMSTEKTKAEKLKEKLFAKKDKGIKSLSAEDIVKADEFCGEYAGEHISLRGVQGVCAGGAILL